MGYSPFSHEINHKESGVLEREEEGRRRRRRLGMMAMASALIPSPSLCSPSSSIPSLSLSRTLSFLSHHFPSSSLLNSRNASNSLTLSPSSSSSSSTTTTSNRFIFKAAEYVFPDPIPEFAEAETSKFSSHLLEKLSKKKKDLFGDSLEEVVGVCSEILSNFLHTEYGGPGTLLVIPFIDMADTINERGLPGAPQAARAAVVWAQKHVDKDWTEWTKGESSSSPK